MESHTIHIVKSVVADVEQLYEYDKSMYIWEFKKLTRDKKSRIFTRRFMARSIAQERRTRLGVQYNTLRRPVLHSAAAS